MPEEASPQAWEQAGREPTGGFLGLLTGPLCLLIDVDTEGHVPEALRPTGTLPTCIHTTEREAPEHTALLARADADSEAGLGDPGLPGGTEETRCWPRGPPGLPRGPAGDPLLRVCLHTPVVQTEQKPR